MSIAIEERSNYITHLLNGTITAFKNIVPIKHDILKPKLLGQSLYLQYGVLIGVTGELKGKLILAGDSTVFGAIGRSMFGMPLEGEMLVSFSGELGNMIAGSLSTVIAQNGIKTDITSPTIMSGETTLSGYEKAIQLTIKLEDIGEMEIYLLLD
ncbi:chemotaxis protein CheX [Lederbergia citrea]|uniref:chemotaxis protein CheX n=1 Tax=Lederbergia citrea TaxID=2833581 RepID=UPI001BC942B1|nr:chemotaxis protein CheX [Lederbergia citrea]MBS4206208.1 chemotaxis protein CheX [Lederbergia citrea]